MRLISPVIADYEQAWSRLRLMLLLISNFHLALDARYAVSDGYLYAAFIHPLSRTLTPEQLNVSHRTSRQSGIELWYNL